MVHDARDCVLGVDSRTTGEKKGRTWSYRTNGTRHELRHCSTAGRHQHPMDYLRQLSTVVDNTVRSLGDRVDCRRLKRAVLRA